MSGSWSDTNYGYDQIGLNDPFDDEINIKHDNNTYKFSYEKNTEKYCIEQNIILFNFQISRQPCVTPRLSPNLIDDFRFSGHINAQMCSNGPGEDFCAI